MIENIDKSSNMDKSLNRYSDKLTQRSTNLTSTSKPLATVFITRLDFTFNWKTNKRYLNVDVQLGL